MNKFGSYIRLRREEKGLLLRQVAAAIDIDTPMLSKVERGTRVLKRIKLQPLSKVLSVSEKELITRWLADKVYDTLRDETWAEEALKFAEEEIKYEVKKNKRRE